MRRVVLVATALLTVPIAASHAQLLTVGAGRLLSARAPQTVYELHAASPPLFRIRAYTTLSWTEDSGKPTVISAAERNLFDARRTAIGLGAGLLWLETNDYRPYPILVSSTVIRLPIPRTSAVAIASTQPFQDFDWSVVLKVAVLAWFRR